MSKIVVTQNLDLFPDQIARLKRLGEVKIYNTLAENYEEWLTRVSDFDIICTGKFGFKQNVYELQGKFISVPFVGVGWLDIEKLNERNIKVANSPGCNRHAVSEWIVGMLISLFRNLPEYINTINPELTKGTPRGLGLKGKNVCILGKGNIGTRTGTICQAFEMNITYFQRGDDLKEKTNKADIIIDCLSYNPSTKGLLDRSFFLSLKHGSFFISPTGTEIYDTDGIIEALDQNILVGAALDGGSIQVGGTTDPYYKKIQAHPKILATPHIAYNTDVTARIGNDIMIDNIEAFIKGKPINLINS